MIWLESPTEAEVRAAVDGSAPKIVALVGSGHVSLGSDLIVDPNTTLLGSFGEGEAGVWFDRDRIHVRGSNVIVDNVLHCGWTTPTSGSEGDNFSVGWSGGQDIERVMMRRLGGLYNSDESMGIYTRGNDATSGAAVRDVTYQDCVSARGLGDLNGMGFIIGDGVRRMSMLRNVVYAHAHRFPFVKTYSRDINIANNVFGGFNESVTQLNGVNSTNWDSFGATQNDNVGVDIVGNVYWIGERFAVTTRGMIQVDGDRARVHVDDNEVHNPLGRAGASLYWETSGTPSPTAHTSDGYAAIAATQARSRVPDDAGPRLYGGRRPAVVLSALDDLKANGPSGGLPDAADVGTSAAPLPSTASGPAGYARHSSGLPAGFVAATGLTDPAAIISDGSAWDGYAVVEMAAEAAAQGVWTD